MSGLAEFSHQEKDSCQALFAGVEELIHKIGLGSHASREHELKKKIGEDRLVIQDSAHFLAADLERRATVDGRGRRKTQSRNRRQRLLPYKISRRQERYRRLFALFRNDGEFCAPSLKIEDCIRWIALGEEVILWLQFDNSPSQSSTGEKLSGRECNSISIDSQLRPHFSVLV